MPNFRDEFRFNVFLLSFCWTRTHGFWNWESLTVILFCLVIFWAVIRGYTIILYFLFLYILKDSCVGNMSIFSVIQVARVNAQKGLFWVWWHKTLWQKFKLRWGGLHHGSQALVLRPHEYWPLEVVSIPDEVEVVKVHSLRAIVPSVMVFGYARPLEAALLLYYMYCFWFFILRLQYYLTWDILMFMCLHTFLRLWICHVTWCAYFYSC